MKIINLIGYSGSGKTFFIEKAIKLVRDNLNKDSAVIKNVHNHPVDKKGKDSDRFIASGAKIALIKNKVNHFALFFKSELNFEFIIEWLREGPISFDILFFEGFRNLKYPTVLCVENENEIRSQLSQYVKIISGNINSFNKIQGEYLGIPIINLQEDFEKFTKIFNLI